jgi:hypothetical protein
MHDVLNALETFHQQAASIFDRVEGACGEVDARLDALTNRLEHAAARVEASRGSTRPLNVHSARMLNAPRSEQRTKRLFESKTLTSLCSAAPLPEEGGTIATRKEVPSVQAAAHNVSRVIHTIATPSSSTVQAAKREQVEQNRLLPAQDRLQSVSELFLFNSVEQLYHNNDPHGQRYVDNLLVPDEVEVIPDSSLMPWQKSNRPGQANLRLDEDVGDPLMQDLTFKPATARAVKFALPEVLPGLAGPTADMVWRQNDQLELETQRPAWDDAPTLNRSRAGTRRQSAMATPKSDTKGRNDTNADLLEAARMLQSQTGPQRKDYERPVAAAPPAKKAPAPAPAKKAAAPAPPKTAGDGNAPEAKASAPQAPKAKGKGKGKNVPKPPENPKGPPKSAMTSSAPAGGGGGKAALMSSIQGGFKLKKAPPPKERCGAPTGKVV